MSPFERDTKLRAIFFPTTDKVVFCLNSAVVQSLQLENAMFIGRNDSLVG